MDPEERKVKQRRFQSLLGNVSAERLFFVLATCEKKPVAFLQLCRERRKRTQFRVRGLHTHCQFRNRSLATRVLRLGCKCISEFYQGGKVFSYILPENKSSLIAHQHAGFHVIRLPIIQLQSENHLCLVWTSGAYGHGITV
ncbi:MAG: hypothetical protein U9R57_04270 [Thermodesulfobacteriota bacterium]|nr:hypothetical protein [Thermodesulfobacteriota bacterium]